MRIHLPRLADLHHDVKIDDLDDVSDSWIFDIAWQQARTVAVVAIFFWLFFHFLSLISGKGTKSEVEDSGQRNINLALSTVYKQR